MGVGDGGAARAGAGAAVVHMLVERDQSLAAVESLTGGLLSSTIVEVAGVSSVFRGGLVVYATDLKSSLADVPEDLLAQRGPVDYDVAVALAEGGRRRCGADWCVSTTGVAGPEPQGGKPVGMVFVAVAGPTGTTVRELDLDGGRDVIRAGAVTAALRLLADQLRLESADARGADAPATVLANADVGNGQAARDER